MVFSFFLMVDSLFHYAWTRAEEISELSSFEFVLSEVIDGVIGLSERG